ncbi:MAG TPA: histidine kinase N-terminal domain-containing protein [Marmoricola sp.]|nr:histidine kinase N-terminal domain-containing protein [Marmoricola sp.]
MPTLTELARAHTELADDDVAWLHLLIADWQIIADLSFADLVLWLPDREGTGFWAGGQQRPTTGPTSYVDDLVGAFIPHGRRLLLDTALAQGRVVREGDPEWRDAVPVRVEAIPVRRAGRILAVIGRHTNLLGVRTPSRLELSYLQTASDLTQMIAEGTFPHAAQRSDHTDSPRVGDGFVRIDTAGTVTYASPNALSVYRRLGLATDLAGLDLATVTRELVPPSRRPDEETVSAVLGGRAPRDTEISNGRTVVIVRSVPLRSAQGPTGALVLLRDVTDLRSRDRELVTKDATIREIHHRVKNNLQTVAALLRLQARRMTVPEARAALEEAVRRVGSIALVHDTLSQSLDESVEFDEIVDRLRVMVADVAAGEAALTSSRTGRFGVIPGEVATPLAMVLTELLQNATEHAFGGGPGHVDVAGERGPDSLRVVVTDDGRGLPDEFDAAASASLGLSIVRTLVESELAGSLRIGRAEGTGTRVEVRIPLE